MISIVTVFKGDISSLERTYCSLASQYDDSFEWIVICPRDSTLSFSDSWIKPQYEHNIDNDVVFLNQVIQCANGRYILFLESGSSINSTCMLKNISLHELNEDIIWGDIVSADRKYSYDYPRREDFSMFYLIEHPIPLQSSLIKRNTFETYDGFDSNNYIAFDFDFFLKTIVTHQCSVRFLPELSVCANPFSFEKHKERISKILETIVVRYPRLIGEDTPQLRLPSEIHSAMQFWRFLQQNTMINLLYTICIKPFIHKK